MNRKFDLGETVLSNKLGSPSVYRIVGWVMGESYYDLLREANHHDTSKTWFKFYEDWDDKPVYFLKSSGPIKCASYSEYLELKPDGTPEHYNSLPSLTVWALPEADLTSLDDL